MTATEAAESLNRILVYEAQVKAIAMRIEQIAKQNLEALQKNLKEAREICAQMRTRLEGASV